ncbi:unnamed protein product [Amoebophrya sp. A25]|nr:unnamed protein product [Amoebophrya sp. A25]|eukprot:GSA25T00019675001.1
MSLTRSYPEKHSVTYNLTKNVYNVLASPASSGSEELQELKKQLKELKQKVDRDEGEKNSSAGAARPSVAVRVAVPGSSSATLLGNLSRKTMKKMGTTLSMKKQKTEKPLLRMKKTAMKAMRSSRTTLKTKNSSMKIMKSVKYKIMKASPTGMKKTPLASSIARTRGGTKIANRTTKATMQSMQKKSVASMKMKMLSKKSMMKTVSKATSSKKTLVRKAMMNKKTAKVQAPRGRRMKRLAGNSTAPSGVSVNVRVG